MEEPTQLLPGLWVLYHEAEQLSYAAVLGDTVAMLIDPGPSGERHPLESFVKAKGLEVGVVVAMGESEVEVASSHMEGVQLPVPGWALVSLPGSGRLAIVSSVEGILFCGDMLSDVRVPSTPQGSQEYLDSLDSIEKLDARVILPSRGAVAQGKREIRQRLERDRSYIYALRRHVQTSKAANVTLERALEVARSVYEDYPYLEQHLDNIRYSWNE